MDQTSSHPTDRADSPNPGEAERPSKPDAASLGLSSNVKASSPSPSSPGRPRRASRHRAHEGIPGQVLGQLRTYIMDQGLQPGDRLPTERQLAQDLGVSRNSVREALANLEAVGAVSRRPKIGCVLQEVDLAALVDVTQFQMLRSMQDLAELYTARRLLEMTILPLAVAHATEADLAHLQRTVDDLESCLERGEPAHEADEAFHRGLFAAAHNKFLFQFGSLVQVFFRESRRRVAGKGRRGNQTAIEHRAIIDAIRRRDLPEAERLLQAHLAVYLTQGIISLASSEDLSGSAGKDSQ